MDEITMMTHAATMASAKMEKNISFPTSCMLKGGGLVIWNMASGCIPASFPFKPFYSSAMPFPPSTWH